MKDTEAKQDPPKGTFLETLEAARSGDSSALDQLFRDFYPRVQAMVHRSMSSGLRQTRPWLARRFSTGDVVQEVFRSVLRDVGSFAGKTEEAFCGYLSMIVRNRLIDAIRFHEAARRDGRRANSRDGVIELEDPKAQDREDDEDAEAFHRAMSKLPEKDQVLLRSRIEIGETFPVLAERLGYSSAKSVRRAFYALQARFLIHLRAELSE